MTRHMSIGRSERLCLLLIPCAWMWAGPLSLTWPPQVKAYLDEVKALISVDVFSFPAFKCVVGSSFYTRLWAIILTPTILLIIIWLLHTAKMRELHLNHIPHPEQDEEARLYMEGRHKERRKGKRDKSKHWVR